MRNYEHLQRLPPAAKAEAIVNISENMCICCPRERERRCNEDCVRGLMEWLLSPYIPGSIIWKRRKRNE